MAKIKKIDIAVFLLSSFLVVLFFGLYQKVQQDDSYIYYKYAFNISSGNGYVFNIGERVNAATSALYTILLALFYSLFKWAPFLSLPILGHIIGAISIGIILMTLYELYKDSTFLVIRFALPIIFISMPNLKNSVGMETFLSLAMISLCLLFYRQNKIFLTSLFLGLSILARPDSMLFALILILDYILSNHKFPSTRYFWGFLLVVSPWILFNSIYFGSPIPSTLSAKMAQTQSGHWGRGMVFLKGLFSAPWPQWKLFRLILFVLFFAAIILLILFYKKWIHSKTTVLIFAWTLAYLFIYSFIINPPAYAWYYTPLSLGMALIFALALEIVFQLILSIKSINKYFSNISRKPPEQLAAAPLIFIMCIVSALMLLINAPRATTQKYLIYRKAANWLNEHVPDGTSVATNEIGIVGFYYNRGKIIDGLGLINPEVAEQVRQKNYDWYIHNLHPDMLLFSYPDRPDLEKMVHEDWFKQQYKMATLLRYNDLAVAIYRKGKN